MFGQVAPTEFDLRFSLFGIPVRVHPSFWLVSALLGWQRERLDMTLVWVLCVFFSVLVHELGHALTSRVFGWHGEIVLYYLGGYATTTRHSTWRDIAVLFAGPAAGFGVAGLLIAVTHGLVHFSIPVENEYVARAVAFLIVINLYWGLFNLLPVLPLDGGQISREFCTWANPRTGIYVCLVISMVLGGLITAFAIKVGFIFMGMMFASMTFESYQMYQAERRGYW